MSAWPTRASWILLAALGAASPARGQTAGAVNLLSAPERWPTTGAPSGLTGSALDPLAIYTNPAGLAAQDERSVLLHHGILAFSTSWDFAAASVPVPGLGAFGLGMARIGTSGIEAYDSGNRALGTIGYSETALAAGLARRVYGPVWAGATFKVLSQALGDVTAAAPGLDVGFLCRPAVLRGAQVGLSAQNIVAGSLDLGGSVPALDRAVRLGVASPELPLGTAAVARGVLDAAHQGNDGTRVRLAAEVSRLGIGAVRAGFAGGKAVFGLGFRYRRYGFDYALAGGPAGSTSQFALRLAWGEPASRYEERRRVEFSQAAQESLLKLRAGRIAEDRARAEAAEAQGDWETSLILWEVLHREDPGEATYGTRAGQARDQIRRRAERAVTSQGAILLSEAMAALARDAMRRGDLEEAAALARGLRETGRDLSGTPAESAAAVTRAVEGARDAAARAALARADTLRSAGKLVASAGAVALALRLVPEDPEARARWADLEGAAAKSAAQTSALGRRVEALSALGEVSRAYTEGRYGDAEAAVRRALQLDPSSEEARAWRDRIARRIATPKADLDARIKPLYIRGMEAFAAGNYREALRNWEQILVLDPLNESARRNVLEARERLKAEARR